MNFVQQIISCFRDAGVDLPDLNVGDDLDLRDYFVDSLSFISAIVEVENTLNIEIPDDFLIYDRFASLTAFCEALKEISSGAQI